MKHLGLAIHGGLLALASALAYYAYTGQKPISPGARQETPIFSATDGSFQRLELVTQARRVQIKAERDEGGAYYTGQLTRIGEAQNDAVKPAAEDGERQEEEAAAPGAALRFIGVGAAAKLAAQLTPVKAFRSLGKLAPERAGEYGLDSPSGTLRIFLKGAEHELLLGGPTPGGTDRYITHRGTGLSYAISGNLVRDLENADSRLVERVLHAFELSELTRVRIIAAGEPPRQRDLVPRGNELRAWARAEAPAELDETATNWMDRVQRLRPTQYHGERPPEGAIPVVRIEYYSGKKQLDELQIVKSPARAPSVSAGLNEAGAYDYSVRTNHTRWYSAVIRSIGEQIEQDLASIVNVD